MLHRYYLYKFADKNIKMLKFISFGSGSCGNCYYIYTEETGLIIDVGIGFRRIKKYLGVHDTDAYIKEFGEVELA